LSKYNLSLEQIENGFIITRPSGKIYRETLKLAIGEVRVAVDQIEREAKAEEVAQSGAPLSSSGTSGSVKVKL
jgi:hypothetical protein